MVFEKGNISGIYFLSVQKGHCSMPEAVLSEQPCVYTWLQIEKQSPEM